MRRLPASIAGCSTSTWLSSVCADAKRSVAYDLKPSSYGDDEEVAARNALKALDLPEWDSIATLIEDERTASLAAFDTGDTNVAYMERPPIEPIYPAFAQHKLPSQLITARSDERVAEAGKSKWPKGWAALPGDSSPCAGRVIEPVPLLSASRVLSIAAVKLAAAGTGYT
ncbi:hypothetical protein ACFQAQ_16170 [Novosphingobium resinovorum]|uniref:hypothetical protein n=1 Tax=Novosphingobium resinovorum TaxID=158500 RepID=UPI00360DEF96